MSRRFLPLFAAVVGIAIGAPRWTSAQQDAAPARARAPLAFEVATIKPAQPGQQGGQIRPLPGGQIYIVVNQPLRMMIKSMYRITDSQIAGGPAWMNTELYDVQAKAEHPSSGDDLHEMFQTLVADRFKLQFHRETRTIPVFVLVVDKPGKVKPHQSGAPTDMRMDRFKYILAGVPMAYFSWFISQRLDRPVLDKTGLAGSYDCELEYLPELPPGYVPPSGREIPDLPDIFGALKDQLGLRLERQKSTVEVLVIDHAEKPAEN